MNTELHKCHIFSVVCHHAIINHVLIMPSTQTMVFYIYVSFWLLAHGSCNISQAETKITQLSKAKLIHKMKTTGLHV